MSTIRDRAGAFADRALDACLVRLDDAIAHLPPWMARFTGGPATTDAGSSAARWVPLDDGDVFVARLPVGTDDPVEAMASFRLLAPRVCPVPVGEVETGVARDQAGKWHVAMVRADRLEKRQARAEGRSSGFVANSEAGRFVFRTELQKRQRRRRVLAAGLVGMAVLAGVFALAGAVERRSVRALDALQDARRAETAAIRTLNVPDAGDDALSIAPADVVVLVDAIAATRPDGWRLLSLRLDAQTLVAQFEFSGEDDTSGQFESALMAWPGLVSVTRQPMGVRNGLHRVELRLVHDRAAS